MIIKNFRVVSNFIVHDYKDSINIDDSLQVACYFILKGLLNDLPVRILMDDGVQRTWCQRDLLTKTRAR